MSAEDALRHFAARVMAFDRRSSGGDDVCTRPQVSIEITDTEADDEVELAFNLDMGKRSARVYLRLRLADMIREAMIFKSR